MRRSSLVLVAVTLLAVVGTSFYSQGQPQNQPPRPARSRADETLAMWNSIGNKLIAMAQDFPEDKYDFKAQRDQRTFAQALLHVAGIDCLLMRTVSGSNIGPDLGKDVVNPSRDVYKTKADVVNLIQQAFADGVESVGLNLSDLSLEGDSEFPFWPAQKPKPVQMRNWPTALGYTVSPGYFNAMGIPLVRGHVFTEQDDAAGPAVAVIDEDLAKSVYPKEDPIGKRLDLGVSTQPAEIVGVVGHVKHWGPDADANAPVHYQIYKSYLRLSGPLLPIMASSTWVVVRSTLNPPVLLGTLRKEISALDNGAAVYDVQTMNAIVGESLAGRTFSMILLAIFAVIALLLATIGIYGVVSYVVGQRTHEIGIRMALGAQPGSVLWMVLAQRGGMGLAGIALGFLASLGLMRLMATMLFGVSATDPVTFAAVVVILLTVALLACSIPARRAMRVDPIVALRYE